MGSTGRGHPTQCQSFSHSVHYKASFSHGKQSRSVALEEFIKAVAEAFDMTSEAELLFTPALNSV